MKRTKFAIALTAVAIVATAAIVTYVYADDVKHEAAHTTQQGVAAKTTDSTAVKPYLLDYCIVSGEKLGEMGDPVVYQYQGRELKFCCKMCIGKFEKDPAKFLAALDEAAAKIKPAAATVADTSKGMKADSTKAAPVKLAKLTWCIVSGEGLDEMGSPVPYTYKDRSLEFCCKSCIKKFEKRPDYYIARLDSALAGQIQQPSEEE